MSEERELRSQSDPEPTDSGEEEVDLRIPAAMARTALSSKHTLMS